MKVLLLQVLALAPLAMGFTVSPRNINLKSTKQKSLPPIVPLDKSHGMAVSRSKPKTGRGSVLFVNPVLFNPELIAPGILIVAGAFATLLVKKDPDDVAVEYIPPPEPLKEETPPPPTAPAPPVPSPAPSPLPDSITYSDKDAQVQSDQSVARTGRASTGIGADVAAYAEKTKTAGDSIAELRRGVAKTLDDTSKVPSTQLLQRSPPAPTPTTEDEKATTEVTTTKKRSLLRKIWRIIKKIVAPWRPWRNIS